MSTGTYGPQVTPLTTIGNDTRSYDAAGNAIGRVAAGEAWGYGYDGYNRMTTVQRGGRTAATYTDMLWQRITMVVGELGGAMAGRHLSKCGCAN